MTSGVLLQSTDARRVSPGVPGFVWLALAVTLLRIAYLAFACPYELVGDEAQYWDWSRRLELSYHTKGPGVAWVIAASTSVFGTSEWSVRLPAAISGGILILAVGGLMRDLAVGSSAAGRMAFAAAALAALIPAFQAVSLLMTIDGPMLACWAVAAWAGWRAMLHPPDGARAPRANLAWWALLGLALGLGFLFKYTTLLLAAGMLGFALRARRDPEARAGGAHTGALVAVAVFTLCALPVIIWNAQRGWPTIAHLLGHLGASGGDAPAQAGSSRPWSPLWLPEFVGAQLGLVGPALALMALALFRRSPIEGLPQRARAFCAWCGLPTIVFYLLVSLVTDAEGNWPIGAYVTLLIPGAALGVSESARIGSRSAAWRARPATERGREGILRARPESAGQIAWHWSIAYGLGAAVVLACLIPLSRLPVVGGVVPIHRISGASVRAVQTWAFIETARARTGSREVMIVSDGYQSAALLAFYLPGRPVVFCAMHVLGRRRTPYDDFADTDLRNPALHGLPAVLVGGGVNKWSRVFQFRSLELVHDPSAGGVTPPRSALAPVCIGFGYGGVRERDTQEERAGDAR